MPRSLTRTATTTVLAALFMCLAAGAGELARPVPSNAQVTRFTRFNLRYTLRDIIADGVKRVDFFISDDMGGTWRLYGEDSDKTSPMTVEVPGEGIYGFVCVATDRFGNREREPQPKTRPETVIIVDRTPPDAKWLTPRQDILGRGQNVELSWEATDAHFGDTPVTLQYAADANGNHDRSARWIDIRSDMPAKGTHNWTPPGSGKFNLRLVAEDRAGNMAVAYCPATISIDSTPPYITDIKPLRSNKLENAITVDASDGDNGSGVKEYSLYVSENHAATWTLVKETGVGGESVPVKRRPGDSITWKASKPGSYPLWPVVFDEAGNATPLPSIGVSGPYSLVIDNEPPQVTLSNSFLMGRNAILSNETRSIEWTSYDPHISEGSGRIHFSSDNGRNWQELRSGLPANGFETISFPFGSQSEEAKIKITIEDDFGNVGEAVSETFKLTNAETRIDSITPRDSSSSSSTPLSDFTDSDNGSFSTPPPSVTPPASPSGSAGNGWFDRLRGGPSSQESSLPPLQDASSGNLLDAFGISPESRRDSYGGSNTDIYGGGAADSYQPLGSVNYNESTAGSLPRAIVPEQPSRPAGSLSGDEEWRPSHGAGLASGPSIPGYGGLGGDSGMGGGLDGLDGIGSGDWQDSAPAASPSSPGQIFGQQTASGAVPPPPWSSGPSAASPGDSAASLAAGLIGGMVPPPTDTAPPAQSPWQSGSGLGQELSSSPQTPAGGQDLLASTEPNRTAAAPPASPTDGWQSSIGAGSSPTPLGGGAAATGIDDWSSSLGDGIQPPSLLPGQGSGSGFGGFGDSGLSLEGLGDGFDMSLPPQTTTASTPPPSSELRPPGMPASPQAPNSTDIAMGSGAGDSAPRQQPWPAVSTELPPQRESGPPPGMPRLDTPQAGAFSPPPLQSAPSRPANPRALADHYIKESKQFRDQGRPDLALDSATKAVESDASYANAYVELSQVNARKDPPDYVRAANLAKEATGLTADWETWWNCADVFYIWAHASNREIQSMLRSGQTSPVNVVDERNSTLSNAGIAINNAASVLPQGDRDAAKKVMITQGMIAYLRALTVPEPSNPGVSEGPAYDEYQRQMSQYKSTEAPLLTEAMPYFQNALQLGGAPEYNELFQLGIINFRMAGLERNTGNASQATVHYKEAVKYLEEATNAANTPKEGPREAYYMLGLSHGQLAEQPNENRTRHRELEMRYWRQTVDFYPPGSPYYNYAEQRMEFLSRELGL